jgi:hypothetical protein
MSTFDLYDKSFATREDLDKALEDFLQTPVETDYRVDEPAASDEDLCKFRGLIYMLARLKWVDRKERVPFRLVLLNKSNTGPFEYQPLPWPHSLTTTEALSRYMDDAQRNLQFSTDALRRGVFELMHFAER